MAIDKPFYDAWTPRALALLRIVTGYLLVVHGTAKLLHVPHVEMFDNLAPFTLIWFAGLLELVGGALLLIGLFTRLTGFVLSGEMAFAYFIGHASNGFVLVPMLNQGELAVLYAFVLLFFAAAGAGAWAVDNRLFKPSDRRLPSTSADRARIDTERPHRA